MRKRIAIGLVAAVAIGVLTMILLRPKQGSVEWHQREYLSAANCLAENRFIDRVQRSFLGSTKKSRPHNEGEEAAKVEEHRKTLAGIGCVIERQFALKYLAVDQAKVGLANTLVNGPGIRNGRFWISTKGDTIVASLPRRVIAHFSISAKRNTITVTAPRAVVAKCEEQIGKVDVR